MNPATEISPRPVTGAAVAELWSGRAAPRVLALGEPTHGEETLLELRNQLFAELVTRHGYRTIALESDCLLGLVVDDYVRTGAGDPDRVVADGLSHGFGAAAGNRDLVDWMRRYNQRRPAAERLRFAGFDGPLEITGAASPRAALTALHAWLADRVDADLLPCDRDTLDRLLGPDQRWTDPAAMRDPSASVGQTDDARRLRVLADDLVALLDAQAPQLVAGCDPEQWYRVRLYGRTAVGLLRYHHWLADPSPGRLARLLAVRATMMADNLLALAERGPVLVYAHNGHLQRHRSSIRMGGAPVAWWSAGALVATRLGRDYAFLATAVGTIRHRGVDAPEPDTIEGLLYRIPGGPHLVAPGQVTTGRPLTHRVSAWFGYAPLDPAEVSGVDGIVFVPDLSPR